MALSYVLSLSVSLISVLISMFVAYKALLSKFSGAIWPVTEVVLGKLSIKDKDHIPVIGVACFLENQGARPGRLDNLRLKVSNANIESSYTFYATMMRRDYSIFASYQEESWFPFGGIGLFEKGKAQEYYVLFKPSEINFVPSSGEYKISMDALWMGSKNWLEIKPTMKINLTDKMIADWRSPTAPAFQVKV
jgi:hypothetical protein